MDALSSEFLRPSVVPEADASDLIDGDEGTTGRDDSVEDEEDGEPGKWSTFLVAREESDDDEDEGENMEEEDSKKWPWCVEEELEHEDDDAKEEDERTWFGQGAAASSHGADGGA